MVTQVLQPRSVEEAVSNLAQYGADAKAIAGGTAVVLMLQNKLISPDVLVSLGSVPGLDYIRRDGDGLVRLGALTTLRTAERSQVLNEHQSALALTYGKVANVRIRNAATVGGNLTEADYASDPPCVLVALRARVKVASLRGEREIPLAHLFTGFYETALEGDELLTELIVPPLPPGMCGTYLKFTTRSTEDRPCLGVAAFVNRDANGNCRDLRVVVGAVDETPREVPGAEAIAEGQPLNNALAREIAQRYAAEIEPLSDLRGSSWYRKEMIRVFVWRAITELARE